MLNVSTPGSNSLQSSAKTGTSVAEVWMSPSLFMLSSRLRGLNKTGEQIGAADLASLKDKAAAVHEWVC